jgi:hypothetical protein
MLHYAPEPAFHSQPGEIDEVAWEAIEISERLGQPERTNGNPPAAEAFFRASKNIGSF